MFSRNKKSKLEVFVNYFAIVYGIIKVLQFLIYVHSISKVIYNEDCEPCVVEYLELTFLLCVFVPLSLLIYGAFKLKQSYVGLWLVIHTIMLGFHCFVQYRVRFSSDRGEYLQETVIAKTAEFIFDLTSFYIICKFNILLINEKREKFAIESGLKENTLC